MRSKVACLVIGALSLAGCGNDVNEPAERDEFRIKSPGRSIAIVDVVRDHARHQLTARVVGDGTNETLSIGPAREGPFPTGSTLELSDESGQMRFSLTVSWDTDARELWVKESTGTDFLILSSEESGGRIREEYNVNGEVAVFDYAALSAEAIDKAARYYQRGGSLEAVAPEIQELMGVFADFSAYYAPHAVNSLHANMDGELLVQIVATPGFLDWVLSDGTPTPEKSKAADRVCSVAGACTQLKCRLGGIQNPLCIACGGVSITCLIASLACSWIVDCN